MEKRILNEFGSKILNEERLEAVVRSRKSSRSAYADMVFLCECDDKGCEEPISMSTDEYERMHHKSRHFIVIPSHVRLDLEEIISSFSTYALVGKFFPHTKP